MGPPLDLAVRPLGLGEVAAGAVALARRRFGPLLLAMLVLEAPALALASLQQARVEALLGVVADPAQVGALPRLGASLAALLGAAVALQVAATAAAVAIVAPALDLGGAPVPPPARRTLAVVTSGVAQLAALAGALAIGALPGAALAARGAAVETQLAGVAAAAVGALAALAIALVRLALVPAAAAVEGRGGIAALIRSWRLMAPRPGETLAERPGVRASIVLTAPFAIAIVASGLAALARLLAARLAAPGPPGPLSGALPPAVALPLSALEAVASAALQPFGVVAVAVLYLDRRARAEAADARKAGALLSVDPR